MKTVAFYTLGCKVNQYETEAISEIFRKKGYTVVDFDDSSDVYVINTCTVTGLSARKSRQAIRRAKSRNPDSIVAVVGCYSQTAPQEVESIEGVDLVMGTRDRKGIVEHVERIKSGSGRLSLVEDIMAARDFEELGVDTYKEHTRAFLKIQEGCSQFCSYCIIPYARGPIRSRRREDVLAEVRKLAESGFREVVLTGIHLASYGKDLKGTSLIDIIHNIHDIDGIDRIRLGSVEPGTISAEFVESVRKLRKLCPHYHISLQSGCDDTLKRMNRRYTTSQYRGIITLLRENIPDVAVTTDVMVGFPGETDREFEQTYSFLNEISFAKMHVFKYSPRKGTPAAGFPGQVGSEAKEERSKRLMELSDSKATEFNSGFVGRIMPVLVEQEVNSSKGFVEGLTANYIRTVSKGDNSYRGKIVDVRLDRAESGYAEGTIVIA